MESVVITKMNGFKEARNCLMGIVLREEFAISRLVQSVSWVRMMGRSPFPTIRSKHATVWNRFCKHTTIALPTQVGLELAPHHVSTGCMPKPLLLHCSTWSWVWTQHRWRNSASVYTMLSKEIKLKARALSPPAEGDVSWDSVHRISVLWILGNPEVHTHLFVLSAWLPSRNKSWTPSYQGRTPGRCLFGEACVKRKSCSGIEWTHGFGHKRLNYVLSPFSSGFLVDSGQCHIFSQVNVSWTQWWLKVRGGDIYTMEMSKYWRVRTFITFITSESLTARPWKSASREKSRCLCALITSSEQRGLWSKKKIIYVLRRTRFGLTLLYQLLPVEPGDGWILKPLKTWFPCL